MEFKYKETSQYKYYRFQLFFNLFCALFFLALFSGFSIWVISITSEALKYRKAAIYFWIAITIFFIIRYLPEEIYYLTKMKSIKHDVYELRRSEVIDISYKTNAKMICKVDDKQSETTYEVLIYRRFTEKDEINVGMYIDVAYGENNVLYYG